MGSHGIKDQVAIVGAGCTRFGEHWDKGADDLLIDYRECPATPGTAARLVVVGSPPGITPGVAEFTVFGEVRRR